MGIIYCFRADVDLLTLLNIPSKTRDFAMFLIFDKNKIVYDAIYLRAKINLLISSS